ncbi:tyrosine-type recombinase/integrase [Ruminococcus sp. OA3]|uniref:tyrosine-type recombinase/integrase n=1 Tax=Ruminococcus sp. OA3 TaxID=2914164 RepID=UPI001F06E75F|nr:tyrosine-type recombinase/integrase [Ruminococcus sp. OA3]MCH1983960.1 tyrosine-type recombinase/integrase [Ruminococcus sp. OA3]
MKKIGLGFRRSAYNHCAPLYDIIFRDLKVAALEKTIKEAKVGDVTKARMENMFSMMYRWAIKHEITNKNYGELCAPIGTIKPTVAKTPFSQEEINKLWDHVADIQYVDMILIEIYSGWRPAELTGLKITDVDLENYYMMGGIKTASGKYRIVPIHDRIFNLIQSRYTKENEYLFVNKDGRYINYDYYYKQFKKAMKTLEMNHSPHETRHTFITNAKAPGLDEYCLKLIVGHEIDDIPEKVYTHRKIEQLRQEINRIP